MQISAWKEAPATEDDADLNEKSATRFRSVLRAHFSAFEFRALRAGASWPLQTKYASEARRKFQRSVGSACQEKTS